MLGVQLAGVVAFKEAVSELFAMTWPPSPPAKDTDVITVQRGGVANAVVGTCNDAATIIVGSKSGNMLLETFRTFSFFMVMPQPFRFHLTLKLLIFDQLGKWERSCT